MGGWKYPPIKQFKIFPGPIRSFTEKENDIRENLRYRQKTLLVYITGYPLDLESSVGYF